MRPIASLEQAVPVREVLATLPLLSIHMQLVSPGAGLAPHGRAPWRRHPEHYFMVAEAADE